MSGEPYIPRTQDVRKAYARNEAGEIDLEREKAFNRWLNNKMRKRRVDKRRRSG